MGKVHSTVRRERPIPGITHLAARKNYTEKIFPAPARALFLGIDHAAAWKNYTAKIFPLRRGAIAAAVAMKTADTISISHVLYSSILD